MRRSWILIGAMAAVAALVGCSDDSDGDGGVPSARLSDAEPAPSGDPIVMTSALAGLPLSPPLSRGQDFEGDLTLLKNSSSFPLIIERFNTAVVKVQILDEREAVFTNPDNVRNNPAPYQPRRRVDDLFGEVDSVLADNNVEQWDNYVLVFDMFRVSGNWLVRWNGVNIDDNDEAGLYGLWRADMREDTTGLMLATLDDITADRNVTHVVIGSEMERLMIGGDFPDNPEEFANFVSFYREAKAELSAAYPEIKFSAGLNWDRLVTSVAARYTTGGTVGEVKPGEIRRAWQEVAEPLYEDSDFLALASEPDPSLYADNPDNLPTGHYAMLAEVQGDRPVVWHSVNWPINSRAVKNTQEDFLEKFLELNAGNTIDLITWKSMIDLPEQGDCSIVENLGGPIEECFSGFFSDSVAPTRVSDLFIPAE